MTLSAEIVSNKTFTTVRLREGYDMAEVDDFLDEVEGTIATLTTDKEQLAGANQVLTSRVAELEAENATLGSTGGATAAEVADTETAFADVRTQAVEEASVAWDAERAEYEATIAELRAELDAQAQPAADEPVETETANEAPEAPEEEVDAEEVDAYAGYGLPALEVSADQVRNASHAAARLLEIATRNSEELLAEAKQYAETTVAAADAQAQQVRDDADAAQAAQAAELAQAREEALDALAGEEATLNQNIDELRTFEDGYRSRLRHDLTGFLAALGASGVSPAAEALDEPDTEVAAESDEPAESGVDAAWAEVDDLDQAPTESGTHED